MSNRDPTCIGRVCHVLGSLVTVALETDLAGVAPIFRGRLQAIGQIGSIVRIPQGLTDLIATVSLLGISELSGGLEPAGLTVTGQRWLQVQLVGEIVRGTGRFDRGVGTYPGLDDPVHFATGDDLLSVFPGPSADHLRVGRLAAAEDVPVCVNAARLVLRHTAIVGSTGSGKTTAVASILQGFLDGGWTSSNIVVIDPHGEYASAVGSRADKRSVLGNGDARLRIPHWSLPAADILTIFAGTAGGAARSRFAELVCEARQTFVAAADWLALDPGAITEDTPVPFDLRTVWYRLDRENRRTLDDKKNDIEALVAEGSADSLVAAEFKPFGPGGATPHKSGTYDAYGRTPELLRLGLQDPRLQFLLDTPSASAGQTDPLHNALLEWIGGAKPMSILDFSGVPADVAELAIGVVLDLLFEAAVRSPDGGPGLGRSAPILIVLEEAHRYLGPDASYIARAAANRIAREGRKYGVGLFLVTQRPSELPDTALAQCGTVIALRLNNQADQGKIRAVLPDSVAGLAAALPSLRTGEAIISGEASILPARALVDRADPMPRAEDPSLDSWRRSPDAPDLTRPLAAWRGIYTENELGT